MSRSNYNLNRFIVPTWLVAFLAIILCGGCYTRVSQLDPSAAPSSSTTEEASPSGGSSALKTETAMEIKTHDSVNNGSLPQRVVDAPAPPAHLAAKQLAPKTIEPKPAAATENHLEQPALSTIGSDKEPAITGPPSQDSPKKRPRIFTKKPVIVERNGKVYQPYHLNKNQTLLLLAAQPDIRSRILASTVREVTTPEQQLAAEQLAATFDQQYVEILRQRAAILENAIDGADVEAKLLDLRMTTADLTLRVRTKINEEILSQDQRFELQRLFEESQK